MSYPDDGSGHAPHDPLSPYDYQRLTAKQRRPSRSKTSLQAGTFMAALGVMLSLVFGFLFDLPIFLTISFALWIGAYAFTFFGVNGGREVLGSTTVKIAGIFVLVVLIILSFMYAR